MKSLRTVALVCWSTFYILSSTIGQPIQSDLTLNIRPDTVKVKAFYEGAELKLTGEASRCADIILLLEGKDEKIELNRKGKIFVFWMNTAKIEVENAPYINFLLTSIPDSALCPWDLSLIHI